jgi:hypothetical protein
MFMLHRRAALAAVATAMAATTARAQPLSAAQLALFESPHLAGLQPPTQLEYLFRREEEGREPVEDTILLDVRAAGEPGRFDVTPQFLSGARNLAYPTARGFRGNPLLLFALDRDARELAAATGGTMHWFRERMRRALLHAATQREHKVDFGGQRVPAVSFEVAPFGGEPRAGRFQARRYAFTLAEAVPGRIHSVLSEMPIGEGATLRELIAFRDVRQMETVP